VDVLPKWDETEKELADGTTEKTSVQTNERFDFFRIYWEELVKVVCCASTWGVHARYYYPMSSAVRPSDEDKAPDKQRKLVTVSNEAFVILSLENNEKRWPWYNRWKKLNPDLKHPKRKDNDDNKPEFSHPIGGPNPFGQWEDKGRVRFVELMNIIGQNREEHADMVKVADESMLSFLRMEHGIEEKEKNRKKRRKTNEPEPMTTIAFEDSDDDE
jgi:hypothetical protein